MTTAWVRPLATGLGLVASVLGAHALGYLLLTVLPDAATVALGLDAARPAVVSAFAAAHKDRTYGTILTDLISGDLGQTLDHVPVATELWRSLTLSLPRVVVAIGLVLFTAYGVGLTVGKSRIPAALCGFLAFLPPYVYPFLGLAFLLTVSTPADGPAGFLVVVVSMALAPAALGGAQAASIMQRNLETPYALALLARGATLFRQRLGLFRNLTFELAPSLEKLITGLIAGLVFAEPILGLPGLGTTTLRAIRRADVDLLLAIVLLMGIMIALARMLATAVRRGSGGAEARWDAGA